MIPNKTIAPITITIIDGLVFDSGTTSSVDSIDCGAATLLRDVSRDVSSVVLAVNPEGISSSEVLVIAFMM